MSAPLWQLEDADAFTSAFAEDLFERQRAGRELTALEASLIDLCDLQFHIEVNGFCNVFCQQLSLSRARRLGALLRDMGMHGVAALFDEALVIYCRGRDVSDREFQRLEPFSLDGDAGRRFDEIGEAFLPALFEQLAPATRAFALRHASEMSSYRDS
jgi:hypothetical protein